MNVDYDDIVWGEYMRVWVVVDISKPLLRGKKFMFGSTEQCWIRFSYERLPNICYSCRRLGHVQRDCTYKKISMEDTKKYGFPRGLRQGNIKAEGAVAQSN